MNAAFLLVSAWLAGQAPADAPAANAPAPADAPAAAAPAPAAAPATNGGCCGSSYGGTSGCCDSCCNSGGLFGGGRLRGLFSKCKGGNDCCNTTSSCCDDGCGRRGFLSRLGGLCKKNRCDDCGTCGSSSSCCDDGCGRKRLFGGGGGFLRGLFRKGGDCCDSCGSSYGGYNGCGSGCANGGCGAAQPAPAGTPAEPIPAPKGGEAPKKMPETGAQAMKQVILNPATETNNPFELHRRYESRVSHAPDFSWLTGQLFYVHADGGLWILRYAPLWQEDPNGGSIVLARDLRMASYREGDLVTVHGEILSKKSSVFLGGPLYRAQSIELVDREAK